jgi:hypothetical protein
MTCGRPGSYRAMRRAWWLLGGIPLLVGCAETGDYTPQIHVTPGAAARVLWIESHRPRVAPAAEPSSAQAAALEGGQESDDTRGGDADEDADAAAGDGYR